MNVKVNRHICGGCKSCVLLSSAVFMMDSGKAAPVTNPVPGGLEALCLNAIEKCPEKAISICVPQAFMLTKTGSNTVRLLAL